MISLTCGCRLNAKHACKNIQMRHFGVVIARPLVLLSDAHVDTVIDARLPASPAQINKVSVLLLMPPITQSAQGFPRPRPRTPPPAFSTTQSLHRGRPRQNLDGSPSPLPLQHLGVFLCSPLKIFTVVTFQRCTQRFLLLPIASL